MKNSDAVQQWLNTASRYPLLTPEQTLILSRQVRAWQDEGKSPKAGQRALDKMVVSNLRLCPKVWRQYCGSINSNSESALDLLQAGAIGIRTAALKFDPTRGYAFSTVAYLWIRKEMQDWCRNSERNIRVSSGCMAVGGIYSSWAAEFRTEQGRMPTDEEAGVRFNCKPETLRFYLERFAMTRTASLNITVGNDDYTEIAEIIPDEKQFSLEEFDRRFGLQSLVLMLAKRTQLEPEMIYAAMEWKGAQPKEIKKLRHHIRTQGRRLWKTNRVARKLLCD